MAYLDLREPMLAAPYVPVADAVDANFDAIEWEVIGLAREDGLASLAEPSRLARMLALLFGTPADRRLGNPRLEALRQFAVQAWHHGYTLPVSAIKAFKEAGFSPDHAELLLASVAVRRAKRVRYA